jgi:hypothetical protein
MKAPYLIYIILITFFISCKGKDESAKKVAPPADIVSPEQMEAVLVDVLLAEGATGVSEMQNHDAKNLALHYDSYVLKQHNMTNRQFTANFNYYAGDIDQMEKIITEVISQLSVKQGKVKE